MTGQEKDSPFCEAFWYVGRYRHACMYRKGHVGSCWCCLPEDGYPGGDLSVLTPSSPENVEEPSHTTSGPHSRACGWQYHPHGSACSPNCPTCHGRPLPPENVDSPGVSQ